MRKTITGGDRQLYLHHVWITLQLHPLTRHSGFFSVQLILIKSTVATNTPHVNILSSVLSDECICICICVCACVSGGVSGG